MSEFEQAFEKMIRNEGGYVLHLVSGDRGGQTYAGIARNFYPDWVGWNLIDRDDMENPQLTHMVREFYRENFWDKVQGDKITRRRVAETLFDFAVNAGVRTASKLAQLVVDATPDGIIGPKSLAKLNQADEEAFIAKYALAKMTRYAEICKRDPSQKKFLLGWINRTLEGLA